MLPAITEEKVGATGTGTSGNFKVNENYPLKQPQVYPEVLVISYPELEETLTKKLGFKIVTSDTENDALEKFELAAKQATDKQSQFYSYVMVNIDDDKVVLERFSRKMQEITQKYSITAEIRFYAFGSTKTDKLSNDVKEAGFTFYQKPKQTQMLDVLRHMVPLDDAITKSGNVKTRGRKTLGNSAAGLNLPSARGDDEDQQSQHSRMVRQNILDVKRDVIKAGQQKEVTLE